MIDGIPIVQLTASTLLGIAILLILTGRLYTKTAYDEKKLEADRWHQAYETERESRIESDAQTRELLEMARTTRDYIQAMAGQANRIRQSGDTDVASKS